MGERPVIFSASMVRAILAGRKTMTRRLATSPLTKCSAGDRLWVREAFAVHHAAEPRVYARGDGHPWGSPIYRATFTGGLLPICEGFTPWRPSIHMPRWASRITLSVTAIKTEPLQDITIADALAEGALEATEIPYVGAMTGDQARVAFSLLWDKLHGPLSWEQNPEVVAISFKMLPGRGDA